MGVCVGGGGRAGSKIPGENELWEQGWGGGVGEKGGGGGDV